MNKKQITSSLGRVGEQLPLPTAEELWSKPVAKQAEHDFITAQELPQQRAATPRLLPALCTCCALLLFVGLGWFWQYRMVVSTILLDVNPSIQVTANRQDQVLQVTGLNEDGRRLLEGKSYAGAPLPQVMGSLADSLAQADYLNADHATVLLSVESLRGGHAQELENTLSASIQAALEPRQITPNIITQTMERDDALQQAAEEQHISPGKMKFIQMILEEEDDYTMEELSSMNMDELRRIAWRELDEDADWEDPDEDEEPEEEEEELDQKDVDQEEPDDQEEDDEPSSQEEDSDSDDEEEEDEPDSDNGDEDPGEEDSGSDGDEDSEDEDD